MRSYWIPSLFLTPHTYLSLLFVTSAYYDALREFVKGSFVTTALHQELIRLIDANLVHPTRKVDDLNILALVQLIIGEVVMGERIVAQLHEAGLQKMVQLRGGLNCLGVNGRLASMISWSMLASAILREEKPARIYSDYCVANSATKYPFYTVIPESPLYHPRPDYETLKRSQRCNELSLLLLTDTYMMIERFLQQVGPPILPSVANVFTNKVPRRHTTSAKTN